VDVASETADPICPLRSYYVTDGGATENLGLLSALYALRGALETLHGEHLPEIHLVTIEASATTYDYTPDRGLNAATGGSKERLTGGLTQELLGDVQALANTPSSDRPRVQVHDLALPLAFRSRGGFGTHWMFPDSIVIENPRKAAPLPWYQHQLAAWFSKDPPTAVVNKRQLTDLWTALYEPDGRFCAQPWESKDQQRVAEWICGKESSGAADLAEDIQVTQWHNLVKSLGPGGAAPSP
jgi:hypothetical protein